MSKLCSYYHDRAVTGSDSRCIPYGPTSPYNRPYCLPDKPYEKTRKRITCCECGRRMWARVSFCGDGCCVYYSLPKHKPREWWKKGGGKSGKRLRKAKKAGVKGPKLWSPAAIGRVVGTGYKGRKARKVAVIEV